MQDYRPFPSVTQGPSKGPSPNDNLSTFFPNCLKIFPIGPNSQYFSKKKIAKKLPLKLRNHLM